MELNISGLSGQDSPQIEQHVKVLVLGSGPAGFSAALYAARAELEPVVLTGLELGGQASLTYTIENYPGFPEGVGGAQLGELFQKQAERFGARVEFDTAAEVDLSQRPFRVKAYNCDYLADSLIVATGASPNHLGVSGEVELTGRGVSYCATCDGWFFKDKNVIVVGGGDSALEEGIFLTRYASSVTVVHRRDTLRAGAILQKRAMENPKINFVWNTVITEMVGKDKLEAVKLKNVVSDQEMVHPVDGVFIFIGHTPNTQIFQGQLEMDDLDYIVTDGRMQTSVEGVFAAGEACDPFFRQVVTSAGMGAAAAIQATHYLEKHSSVPQQNPVTQSNDRAA
ncbi:MAG TPA: thioredoxin-disulfide reductase [Anaerolineaceae bacterium]|nr:thioredoxin-disulfide reductase [Anaerolineaceae bacterium]